MPTLTRRKLHRLWAIRKEDKARLMRMRLGWRGVLYVMAGTLPFLLLFNHIGRLELTLPVLASVLVFVLVLMVKWRLRRYFWFWATIAVFVALHVAMLCLVPWTKKWVPAATSAGIASLDIWAMLAVISVIGHLCGSDV